ncbi:ceramide kinase isoform X2 [Punica granatum]|uniref:Ceramide kinase isoform X2 n=1 Tax=Punica granatum TaxID=22663 RepID=A0A6P8CEL2_PUNGR|nr:ceramide kinase isoform X2 [Punica granatum]
MERNGDDSIRDAVGGQEPVLRSSLFLDHVGEVILCLNSDGLSWKLVQSSDTDRNICFRIKLGPPDAADVKFSDIYAVELIDQGVVHRSNPSSPARCLLGPEWQMHRFIVHAVQRSKSQPSLWTAAMYNFGHKDPQTCQMWVDRINASLSREMEDRPKNLLIFVHPMSGKGNGCQTWETVAPIFSRANVQTKVIVTERAGHAFDVMRTTTDEELRQYDGVLAVGGDGFFNEILNGFLSTRLKAAYPPAPADFVQSVGGYNDFSVDEPVADTSSHDEDDSPLIPNNALGAEGDSSYTDGDLKFLVPNERFRLGIIPAGSTDAIVICTTGARDPITSALHIVLGKRVGLDIGQIVRWRITSTSKVEPCARYAASFAGYGFYGDVITESEKYRWMGPKRYDYSGTKVFMRHRSYEAEIACLEIKAQEGTIPSEGQKKCRRVICRVDCKICNAKTAGDPNVRGREANWLRSKGRYLSVGAAIMANRNERAPDGLVADAHLGDGFLHLILIKDCPRALYLLHLLQLAKKDGNPLNFEFVEHHKTRAFTFKSSGNSSIWNLDGEPFPAHQLSAQVFRRLVSLFASGPLV